MKQTYVNSRDWQDLQKPIKAKTLKGFPCFIAEQIRGKLIFCQEWNGFDGCRGCQIYHEWVKKYDHPLS